MPNQRNILLIAFALVSLMVWQAWQQDYAPRPVSNETASMAAGDGSTGSQLADLSVPSAPTVDAMGSSPSVPELENSTAVVSGSALVKVRTDLLELMIDTRGGSIVSLKLLNYPVTKNQPDVPFDLFEHTRRRTLIAQSGLTAAKGKGSNVDHTTLYAIDRTNFELNEGEDELRITLTAETRDGLKISKNFILKRDSYAIRIVHQIENNSGQNWEGSQYRQFLRSLPGDDETSTFIQTYNGAAYYSEANNYSKLSFGDMDDGATIETQKGGWITLIQHYFIGAWIADPEANNQIYARRQSPGLYQVGMTSWPQTIAAGAQGKFETVLFAGPKEQERLKKIAPQLELSVDYGYLFFISEILFFVLVWLHKVLGNWGWSIIGLTMLIKLVFFKLSEKSYKSMARMRKLTPRLQALKERFGDDKQALNKAMMEMYKTEKVNPLGGCLPILIQIPVFIALYWVLLESVEVRQAPWILWITDMSVKDPYFILPVVMGITMFVQQKLNPAPMDPMQAKVMMFLPFVFTIFFATFPSGLVLYWVVNNLLSIAQQWVITRRIERGEE